MGAYGYYSTRSGLAPAENFTLADHQLAYWRGVTGATDGSLADAELAFLRQTLPDEQQHESLADLRYRYFAGLSGLGVGNFSISDHRDAFYIANP